MARKKNLERAIVLGLILSTSIYTYTMAAEVTTKEFTEGKYADGSPIYGIIVDDDIINVSESTIINATNNNEWFNPKQKINVVGNKDLTFNNLWLQDANIQSDGNIIINSGTGTAIWMGGSIKADKLVLNSSTGSGISTYNYVDGTIKDVILDVNNLVINSGNNGIVTQNETNNKVSVIIDDTQSVDIFSSGSYAIHTVSNGSVYIRSEKTDSVINAMGFNGVSHTTSGETVLKADNINIGSYHLWGVNSEGGGTFNIDAKENIFIGDKFIDENRIGQYADQAANVKSSANLIINADTGNVKIIGKKGLRALSNGQATVSAGLTNTILAGDLAVQAAGGNINIKAQENIVAADEDVVNNNLNFDYGNKIAVSSTDSSNAILEANNSNTIYGAVYATGKNSTVDISKLEQTGTTFSRNAAGDVNNFVRSAAVIEDAGDLDGKETIENPNGEIEVTGMDVISALYAQEGAKINLSGVNNILTYYDDPSDEHTSERAVWAYKGADITIDGVTNISTSKYEISPENRDIAIAAGTATELKEDDFTEVALGKVEVANVNLNYKAGSAIKGDILAAYGGVVNITDANAASRDVNGGAGTGIAITGDLLAGNNGKLTVDLGNSGVLIGRADDYGDAELNNGHGSGDEDGFYNPAFSSNILHGGEVTLNMGNGSQWSVQGQSWITNLNTNGNVLIDLTNASTEYESNAHALTVRNLNGDANIKMNLNGDRTQSDMLYIGKGNGTYNIELEEVVDVGDMYAEYKNDDSGEGFKFSGLRFATVGKGSDVDFNVTATDKGFNNIIYTVGKDVYGSNVSNHENDAYNNGDGTSLYKPGNAAVEDLLKDAEQAGAATINTNDIMLLANEPDTGENLDNNENHLNYKLIDMHTEYSDTGKAIIATSRANYSNAIYMDRLNKRLGEARYINSEEDEGMWVRIRHDRIGKDDAYRSQNTMYELGYDQKQECDNGERRVGMAIDYMHGDTGYDQIAGKGEIDRYGLWLYDTWMGDKGHYADYVAKWGHLDNEFEIYAPTTGEKINGDYSNNVFSVSAEYGRKKDIGNDWYFEPQVQAQLARVTGADYTTSQGTKVSVDGINSLIGRAGFRLGKDFGEEKQSTVYIKADVLHEFLGDQDIKAMDATTNGNWSKISYENEGTWYDVGFGFATQMSKNSYAFMDFEKSFGNDNDETYQINVGMQWSF